MGFKPITILIGVVGMAIGMYCISNNNFIGFGIANMVAIGGMIVTIATGKKTAPAPEERTGY